MTALIGPRYAVLHEVVKRTNNTKAGLAEEVRFGSHAGLRTP